MLERCSLVGPPTNTVAVTMPDIFSELWTACDRNALVIASVLTVANLGVIWVGVARRHWFLRLLVLAAFGWAVIAARVYEGAAFLAVQGVGTYCTAWAPTASTTAASRRNGPKCSKATAISSWTPRPQTPSRPQLRTRGPGRTERYEPRSARAAAACLAATLTYPAYAPARPLTLPIPLLARFPFLLAWPLPRWDTIGRCYRRGCR